MIESRTTAISDIRQGLRHLEENLWCILGQAEYFE